jgi:lipid-binding SYLF domain-containing protein
MTERGVDKVLSGKLGADASVAGPSGANAAASMIPTSTYRRLPSPKGLFAGALLGSASMGGGNDGKRVDATQIVRDGAVPVPPAGKPPVNLLHKAFVRANVAGDLVRHKTASWGHSGSNSR